MSPMRPKKSELNSENGREAAVSGIAETASRPKKGKKPWQLLEQGPLKRDSWESPSIMGAVVQTMKGHRCLGNGRYSWVLGSIREEGLGTSLYSFLRVEGPRTRPPR